MEEKGKEHYLHAEGCNITTSQYQEKLGPFPEVNGEEENAATIEKKMLSNHP